MSLTYEHEDDPQPSLIVSELPNEFWIVVTQWDCPPDNKYGEPACGPLVHEGYCLTEQKARERAEYLGSSRYGWVKIFKVNSKEQ